MSSPLRAIDEIRLQASRQLDPAEKSRLGQYMTPTAIADFMASLFTQWPNHMRLLDAGAGLGSLTEAFTERFFSEAPKGSTLEASTFEINHLLLNYLSVHMDDLAEKAEARGLRFISAINDRDFITEASFQLSFGGPRFTHAILNPPYKKINNDSDHRKALRTIGIETVNLYTAFLGLAVAMTELGGEIVAIIPRSFCNGTYFRPFREWLLTRVALKHIHVFESRTKAFKDDEVLQENIIIHLKRDAPQGAVIVSTSCDSSFSDYNEQTLAFTEIVKPSDEEQFIHIPTLEIDGPDWLFVRSLKELDLEISTGPVVDFRLRDHWLTDPAPASVPLLYAHHFSGGHFDWPRVNKKPNALKLNDETMKWLMPRGWYCITKRFSSKEERRRLVAHVVNPQTLPYEKIGFENHLNVFHSRKQGILPELAYGLSVFLNSTIVDQHF
ncbi:MAG TPA: Eco57I restriction-modification methylase domain-containing protein, partial [Pyrinomonadaceae bacterium]|nr:Eco57I restriction-modification methylase domain-containing protein [Pyrinomonadaceae bacterium]